MVDVYFHKLAQIVQNLLVEQGLNQPCPVLSEDFPQSFDLRVLCNSTITFINTGINYFVCK